MKEKNSGDGLNIKLNLINEIEEITKYILLKISEYELDSIEIMMEKRFSLIQDLVENNINDDLSSYLQDLITKNKKIMDLIHDKQAEINHTIINLNVLKKYYV